MKSIRFIIRVFIAAFFLLGLSVILAGGLNAYQPNDSRKVLVNVTDAVGQPVASAKVFVDYRGALGPFTEVYLTDESGYLSFDMPDGSASLKIWKSGLIPKFYDFTKDGETELSFRLNDYRPLSLVPYLFKAFKNCPVVVTDEAGGNLEDAVVLYVFKSRQIRVAGYYVVEEYTDANGNAVMTVPDIPGDASMMIWVYKDGYIPEFTPYVCPGGGAHQPKITILKSAP